MRREEQLKAQLALASSSPPTSNAFWQQTAALGCIDQNRVVDSEAGGERACSQQGAVVGEESSGGGLGASSGGEGAHTGSANVQMVAGSSPRFVDMQQQASASIPE